MEITCAGGAQARFAVARYRQTGNQRGAAGGENDACHAVIRGVIPGILSSGRAQMALRCWLVGIEQRHDNFAFAFKRMTAMREAHVVDQQHVTSLPSESPRNPIESAQLPALHLAVAGCLHCVFKAIENVVDIGFRDD